MHSTAPLSVVIPALDPGPPFGECLDSLEEGRARGLVAEVIVVDGGSRDGSPSLALRRGARLVEAPRGRGPQLAAGAAASVGAWLLFLHADTRLAPGWACCAAAFMTAPENRDRAGYFRFRLDDSAPAARRLESMVAARCRWLGLPYGDQGLFLSRALYEAVGGFRRLPLMEDVDFVRRLGRRRLVPLAAVATTSARRYRRSGYARRMLRNGCCLGLFFLGVPPRLIAKLYA